MRYEVTKKDYSSSEKGDTYCLRMGSREPEYLCSILTVTAEQFASVKIGDTVEISIAVVPKVAA